MVHIGSREEEEELPVESWEPSPDETVRRDRAPYRNPHGNPLARYDHLGRKQPRRLSLAAIILAVPGMAARTRVVPAAAITEQTETEEGATALVRCSCGAQPVVSDALEKCSGCERNYVVLGEQVLVIYGAMEPPRRKRLSPVVD